MDTLVIVLLVIVLLLVAAGGLAAGFYFANRRRSEELRSRFGPEYERAVRERGRSEAERELNMRTSRVESLPIRALDTDERIRFADAWRAVQVQFVDEPETAIGEADSLVQEVMSRRGYPMTDFEQRSADISVDHPEVVSNYREAHAIAVAHQREGASTERLRQALLHYRALFDELLGEKAAHR